MHWDIIIIGGGFAGLQACQALRQISDRIALIDPGPITTMLPSLPDVAGGWMAERFVQAPLATKLPPNVTHIPLAVSAINLDADTIVAGGKVISFGHLLIAAGSVPDFKHVDFPRDRIYSLGSLSDALRIRQDFSAYLRETAHPHVLVAGSGYTGLELAMSLFFRAKAAGKSCAVTIVDPTPILLPSLPDKQRQYVLDFLVAQGAEVRLGVAVEAFDGRNAVAGGRTYENVFFCWAAGSAFAVPEVTGPRRPPARRAPEGAPRPVSAGISQRLRRRRFRRHRAARAGAAQGRQFRLLRRPPRRAQHRPPPARHAPAPFPPGGPRLDRAVPRHQHRTAAGRPLGARPPRRAPAPPDVRPSQLLVRQLRRLLETGIEPIQRKNT